MPIEFQRRNRGRLYATVCHRSQYKSLARHPRKYGLERIDFPGRPRIRLLLIPSLTPILPLSCQRLGDLLQGQRVEHVSFFQPTSPRHIHTIPDM
jgi:hypothetical protein